MSPPLTLRAAAATDLAACQHLWQRCYLIENEPWLEAGAARWRFEDTRVVEAGERVVACGRLLGLETWLGGRRVGLGGIASLATLPEYRRRGAIGALIEGLLAELREVGAGLSALYPFDSGFYRRYGWALADDTVVVRVPTRALVGGRPRGRIAEVEVAEPELGALHARWAPRHNLALVRDGWWWDHYVALRSFGPLVPRRYAYRYHAPTGEPEGYVIVSFAMVEGARVLQVHELCAATPGARVELLGFLGDLDSQAAHVELRLPAGDPLRAGLARFDDCRVETRFALTAMARIVSLEAVVGGATAGGANAGAVIAIDDAHAPWTARRWRVAIDAGRASIEPTTAAAEVELSIQTATQLVTGFMSHVAAVEAGLAIGSRPEACELLARLAGGRRPFHNDTY
jgi:predicted acetyltransferase